MLKVLVLTPAPLDISPGQRFRFEQYLKLDDKAKPEFSIRPFFSQRTWSLLHLKGRTAEKIFGICAGFLQRFFLLFKLSRYDFVYIYREAAMIGPPIFEWLIARLFRKKVIYDFDDAIWVSTASEANPGAALIKCTWKVKYICKWSRTVTVGNHFLAEYASQFCKDVRVIPTVVNTSSKHNIVKNHSTLPVIIGWTGTFTNFVQLDKVIKPLSRIQREYPVKIMIIADKDPLYQEIEYEFKRWNRETEIDDLLQFHIGLMPLGSTVLELGKCAFKAIQYMSLGIPAIVSEVGANKKVVTHGENGYWANSDDDWFNYIEKLILDEDTRTGMGKQGRATVIQQYSVDSSKKTFFSLFN